MLDRVVTNRIFEITTFIENRRPVVINLAVEDQGGAMFESEKSSGSKKSR